MISKTTIFLLMTTGSLVVYADLPLYLLFGIVYSVIRIELDRSEKKLYPIVINVTLSSIIGWAVSSGVKHKYPFLFEGSLKIFTIFILTLFSYTIIIYILKNKTIETIVDKYLRKKGNLES